ncbi:amidohydrolase [Thermomicrobium sp. 4228-Ro]|uniref:amidohydrolase n=1 Tax=Thermomicrobium sp. 4228-Ro TaxID=2993937 RepID=UPI002248F45B|nr:amidohydrolase [Thermomicrobium sp. 4228-Ro]MCX2726475.1 amidohydrolase [Thermomicrobium sp. 4228-Ro]
MVADLVLRNANVLTLDPAQPRAQALSVWRGRILAVGDEDRVLEDAGPGTRILDLAGATVLPAFDDAHCHPIGLGLALEWVDVSPEAAPTLARLLDRLAEAARSLPPDRWLLARGYDDSRLDVRRHPTRWELDTVTGDRPAIVIRTCGHMLVANSAALARAGITRETPDPEGGRIVRDETGEPTGLLQERAQELVRQLLPEPTISDLERALRRAGERFLSLGIASVTEAGIGRPEELLAYQNLRERGELPVRSRVMLLIDQLLEPAERLGLRSGFGDDWLRIGPFKLFQDGAGGARTAAMSVPYPGEPQNYGIAYYTQEQLDDAFRRVARLGCQAAAHAIGDRAIEMVLTAYERALADYPLADHRWRIEHCGMLRPDLLQRLARLGVVAVPQPGFGYYLGDAYLRNFSDEWLALAYPTRAWLERGIAVAFSSDAPVIPPDPWVGIQAAVLRRTRTGQPFGPQQRVDTLEALRLYTAGGAYAHFEEDRKGRIAPGFLADLVVVDRDPLAVDPEELPAIRTLVTIVDGRVAWEA